MSTIGARVLTAPPIPDLSPTVKHIDAATGAWASASAQQVASVAAIERDLRAELWHVDRFLTTGSGTLQAAQGAIDTLNLQLTHVAPLLDAATVTVASIPPAVKQVTNGITPVLINADGAITDVRAFIDQKPLTETLGNIDKLTGEWAAISGDFRQVSDKTTADYLKPVPWYLWPVKRSGELLDIGAAVARHTP